MTGATQKIILLVEDVPLNRDLIVQLLEDHYRVVQACDGFEGVAMAIQKRPDLILMDLSLPGLDGWEAIRRIRNHAETRHIPIIALTAHAMIGDKEKAIALGCDDYLTKPIDERLLLKTVHHFLTSNKM